MMIIIIIMISSLSTEEQSVCVPDATLCWSQAAMLVAF
jgi:hypothetical protein